MHEIHIWNDLQGDFIQYRGDDGKIALFADYDEAAELAMSFLARGVQAKVVYVRRAVLERPKRRKNMNGRMRRIVKAHEVAILDGADFNDLRCNNCGKSVDVSMADGKWSHRA